MVVGLHSSWPAPFTSRVHAWHLPSPFLVPSGIIRLRLYESQEPVSHTQDHLYCRLQENLLDSSWSAFLIYAWVECRRAFFGVFCCRHAEGFGLLRKICGDEASSSRLSNSVTLFSFVFLFYFWLMWYLVKWQIVVYWGVVMPFQTRYFNGSSEVFQQECCFFYILKPVAVTHNDIGEIVEPANTPTK